MTRRGQALIQSVRGRMIVIVFLKRVVTNRFKAGMRRGRGMGIFRRSISSTTSRGKHDGFMTVMEMCYEKRVYLRF